MEDWLRSAARERPRHPAVIAGEEEISYADLDAAASGTARRLAALGVRSGDRVATTLPPGRAFVELLHALPRLGAALVPLDPRLTEEARRRRLGLAGALLVVEEPPAAEPTPDAELRERLDPGDVHTVIFTSGTTGVPRPVELTYANHAASAAASARRLGVERDDRWLCPLPLFHVGGLAVLLRCAAYGTTALLHESFAAERVKADLESGEATLVSLVPTMLHRLRDAGLREAPRLRAALLGGGPIPPGLLHWASRRGLPVMPTYGMTEAASQIATADPGERWARPLPGVEIRIGEGGEVLVRGPMVAPGTLAPDGWLHTGDSGSLDQRGRLRVHGRLKDLIVTGGENVSPAEVERVLLEHPAVADAGVVGVPDPQWGEAVSAFVVLDGAATAEQLEAHCRERLAPHEVPKRIEQVPALPRNPSGKLLRAELAPPQRRSRVRRP